MKPTRSLLIISIIVAGIICFCFTGLVSVYLSVPTESEIICQNLKTAQLMEPDTKCADSNWSLDYVPYYFPLGSTVDRIKTGMSDFELLGTFKDSPCRSGGKEYLQLRYGLTPVLGIHQEELIFYFSDDSLIDYSSHN